MALRPRQRSENCLPHCPHSNKAHTVGLNQSGCSKGDRPGPGLPLLSVAMAAAVFCFPERKTWTEMKRLSDRAMERQKNISPIQICPIKLQYCKFTHFNVHMCSWICLIVGSLLACMIVEVIFEDDVWVNVWFSVGGTRYLACSILILRFAHLDPFLYLHVRVCLRVSICLDISTTSRYRGIW